MIILLSARAIENAFPGIEKAVLADGFFGQMRVRFTGEIYTNSAADSVSGRCREVFVFHFPRVIHRMIGRMPDQIP